MTSRSSSARYLRDLARLRRGRDRIDREYAQPPDVEALARGARMSAGYLSREFRLACGEAPYARLMARRIEHGTARAAAGMPSRLTRQATIPIRIREARPPGRG